MPLNDTLFNLLKRHQKWNGDVGITAQGISIDWYIVNRRFTEQRSGGQQSKPARKVRYSGEEYRVNCPFCHDTRQRLFINHRWGVKDPETGGLNLFLAHCWNEECIYNYTRQKQLYDFVMAGAGERTRRGEMRVDLGRIAPKDVGEVAPPGQLVSLSELKANVPEHDAVIYLEGRGFDLDYLSNRFQAAYCPKSRYRLAQDRIIIPIVENDMMIGWQARYVGDDVRGVKFNKAGVPKFWSCPGMCRRMVAYNREVAQKHDTVVIVEGPTDVWQAGPQCMGVIGKTMHPDLIMRFCEKLDDDQIVCIALDPEQDEKAKKRGRPHHIEALRMALAKYLDHRVFPLYLPEGCDPGDLDHQVFRDFVKRAAKEHGLEAKFIKPRR